MTTNPILNNVSNSYQSSAGEKQAQNDALGRDAFLTMLIAQLKNQDPLNPMEGTEFSSQLAQFSQLEQLMNINESIKNSDSTNNPSSSVDPMTYLNKTVTGNVDTMQVKDGSASAGIFRLTSTSEIRVAIVDSSGKTVKTMDLGNKVAGNHTFQWDGNDSTGAKVADGTYTYKVLANDGTGFKELPTSVSGKVEGVVYDNGKPFLVVQGVLMDLDALISVVAPSDSSDGDSNPQNILEYLGKTVKTDTPIIAVEDGAVQNKELTYNLDGQEEVTVKIYDAFNNLVRTETIAKDETSSGANTYSWDGLDENGNAAGDGLYRFEVSTASGNADIGVSGKVSGIKTIGGKQFLVLEGNQRLVSPSSITSISQ
ncbi:MAG: flagellar hook capping protein [Desulfobacterales bacterium]|nr:flagellar hook capping protein [Desulfobacterales bacterium]